MKKTLALALSTLVAIAAGMTLIEPRELAGVVAGKAVKPAIFHVGPNVLYRGKHIPESVYAGPGNAAAGIEKLKAAAETLPRDREIVIYCGCCPWDRCPNVKPAIEALQAMGFTKVKAAHLETGFKVDWTDQGYPVETGQ